MTTEPPVPLTYEVIYGQAWCPVFRPDQDTGDIYVPIDILRKGMR